MSPRRMVLLKLGLMAYDAVHALQLQLVEWRQADRIGDALILVEHLPVITLGRRADESHILAPPEVLAREGIAVRRIERGGDVTYHGPGQVVAYPILRLADYGLGVSDYMHTLEQALIRTCADYGLQAYLRDKIIGVWVGGNKIGALGVRVRRGVTFHGLAFNVNPDMRHWGLIIPCGITDGGVTSLAQELGRAPAVDEVQMLVGAHLAALLGVELAARTVAQLERQVAAS